MISIRTDLAEELRSEAMKAPDAPKGELDGIKYSLRDEGNAKVSTIEILNENGEKALGRKKGKYVTVSYEKLTDISYDGFVSLCDTVSRSLLSVCDDCVKEPKSILVCGLGNRAMTPDAIGPCAVDFVLVTHHIKRYDKTLFENVGFFDVSAVTPGVTAQTGIEAVDIIKAAVSASSPDLVIAIDSLAAREARRLAKTIQISDTGISPGSGIGNDRATLDSSHLGIPVVAIGVPTVVDTATLLRDATENQKNTGGTDYGWLSKSFVCPKEIDSIGLSCSRLIGYAINRAFHKNIPYNEMFLF